MILIAIVIMLDFFSEYGLNPASLFQKSEPVIF